MERESNSVVSAIWGRSRVEFRGGFRFDFIGPSLTPAKSSPTSLVLTLFVALFLFSYVPSRTGSVFVSPDDTPCSPAAEPGVARDRARTIGFLTCLGDYWT